MVAHKDYAQNIFQCVHLVHQLNQVPDFARTDQPLNRMFAIIPLFILGALNYKIASCYFFVIDRIFIRQ
jgi:hypothetical protein